MISTYLRLVEGTGVPDPTHFSINVQMHFIFPRATAAWNLEQTSASLTSGDTKRYKLWSCQNVCEALIYLLDNIYIRFGTKLYRPTVAIPMGTNCAPLVADLFYFAMKEIS